MNNIGSAATRTTAATNNTNSAQALASLSSLASSFTNSTSSAGGFNFNTLIFSLLMQVIQNLLKNMQNQPGNCDQKPTPAETTLKLSDKELTKLGQLPSLGKPEAGSEPSIDNIIDTDHNNKLSIGDKVNLKQVTDQLDANGQAITKTFTKTLTSNDIAIYDALKAPNQLSSTEQEKAQFALNQGFFGAAGPAQATGGYYDKDANGKLSLGDELEVLNFQGIGAPTPDGLYGVGKRTVDETFLASYEPPPPANSFALTTEQITNLNSDNSIKYVNFDKKTDQVIDTNKDGKLNAGDTLSGTYIPHYNIDGYSQGTVLPWTHDLTENEVKYINGEYGKLFASNQQESDQALLARTKEVLGLNSINSPYVDGIFDKDGDNQLSEGDVAVLITGGARPAVSGEPSPLFPDAYVELTADDVKKINAGTISIPASQQASLDKLFNLSDTSIIDTDSNGDLSKGDVLVGNVISDSSYTTRKVLTDAIIKQALGDYGKDLNLDTQTNQAIADTLNLEAKSVFGDWMQKNIPVQIFDTDASGQISAGDTMVLRPELYKNPSVEQISYQQLRNDDIDKLKAAGILKTNTQPSDLNPSSDLSLSNAEHNKLLHILNIGSRATIGNPTVTSVTDTDHNGVLSVGDMINIKNVTGGYDANTNEPIITYNKTALTSEQFNNYQRLTTDGSLLDVSPSDLSLLQTAYQITGAYGDGPPKVLGVIYDKDNSGDISIGDAIGVQPYTSHSEPNKPEFWALKNTFFETYQQLKNRNN